MFSTSWYVFCCSFMVRSEIENWFFEWPKNSLLTDELLFLYSFTLEKIIYLYLKGISFTGCLVFHFCNATRWTSLQMNFFTTVSLRKKVRFLHILITIFSMRSSQSKKKNKAVIEFRFKGSKIFFSFCVRRIESYFNRWTNIFDLQTGAK